MQLDVSALRFVTKDQWKILHALENCMSVSEHATKGQISSKCNLRTAGIHNLLGDLMTHGLVVYERQKVGEGYRLSWLGYDFLAVHQMMQKGLIDGVGPRIGVGKEADVHIVSKGDERMALKIHRLGRTSFRSAMNNRTYLKPGQKKKGWLHLSALSAQREFEILTRVSMSLQKDGDRLPVPSVFDHNRHCVLMSFANGILLNHIKSLPAVVSQGLMAALYELLTIMLVDYRVVHGDYNEFNLIIDIEALKSAVRMYGGELDDIVYDEADEENADDSSDGEESDEESELCDSEDQTSESGEESGSESEENNLTENNFVEFCSVLRSAITIIDFPQTLGTDHPSSREYFERDVEGIRTFFKRRFNIEASDIPTWDSVMTMLEDKESDEAETDSDDSDESDYSESDSDYSSDDSSESN